MPTYDYRCQKCDHEFEFFQSMSSDRLTDCPQEDCDGQVKRLVGTGAGIIFKGSGFYETDYKRGESYNAAKKADKAESSTSSESSGGDSKKSDSSKESKSSDSSKSKKESGSSTKSSKSSSD